jgi:hypothetical protein
VYLNKIYDSLPNDKEREDIMAKKKGFQNKYITDGDTTVIYIKTKKGEVFETLIDTDDLQKLIDLNLMWHVQWFDFTQSYYASATEYLGMIDGKPKYTTLKLHGVIMNTNERLDHINHNTLDNRKANLRLISVDANAKHRKSKNSNNTSGYRNVSWDGWKWMVQLQIDGRNNILGRFDDVDEAGQFAQEMREKYYGEFKGEE